jgi:signal transduction histidine kinase
VIVFGSVRMRLTVLYAAVFLGSAVVVLGIPLLAVKATYRAGSHAAPVVTRPDSQLYHQLVGSMIGLAVMAVLSVAFGWLLTGRLLRPVQTITTTAREISASDLSRRLSVGTRRRAGLRGRSDEFTRLGETLDDLFGRLEAAFASQRRFVANASHELRTPLAAERTVLQVALADPAADAESLRLACEEALRLGEHQERMIDALLTLATSERGIDRAEPFDLATVAAKVISVRDGGDIRVAAALSPAPATGDPSLAESLVANLVDNALSYNEPGGWVKVVTGQADGRSVLTVSNSGPVVPPASVDSLLQPFRRLDGASRLRKGRGHGLGLAIVQAIARAHHGELTVRARPEGGLDIDVRL